MESLLARHVMWGLLDEQKLVGFALISQVVDESELLDIAIAPQCQGRGWGELLLDFAIEHLNSTIRGMFLEVRASNHSAIALYEKRGFAEVGLRRNYYPTAKGSEDAILMVLDVNV